MRVWPNEAPARLVVLAHGYGEHIGRYEHVAAVLVQRGAAVTDPTTSVTGSPRASGC